jgi:Ca-activated chloride channel homolog
VLPNMELDGGSDEKPPGSDYDLIVVDAAEAGAVQAPVKVFIGLIPEDLRDLIELREDVAYVVDWNRTAPLLRHVQLGDVQMGQQPAWIGEAGAKDLEERGYEVLVDGNAGPLVLQRRQGLEVEFWFTFHTDRSTLPYRVGFPIIAANAAEAALRQASLSEVQSAPTGVLPPISLEPERTYTVKTPDGEQLEATTSTTGILESLPAARVGRYDILDGTDLVTSIGTGLLNGTESSLKSTPEILFTEQSVAAGQSEKLDTDRPLWWILALVAFGVLLYEWWYFQRARGVMA